jgi:signal transduction histidine kinase
MLFRTEAIHIHMPERKTWPMKSPSNLGIVAAAWPVITPNDSDSLRRRKCAVRAGHLAMIIMILFTAGSAVAADLANFSAASLMILGLASTCYVFWNLVGTRGIVALVCWENAAPPPAETRVPPCGAPTYFAVQIPLAGLVYWIADQGHIPNLIWLVLLPPVAYAVFLLGWRGVTFVSLLMIAFLGACVYRWQGLTYTVFAAVAFSFAVLFTLVFSLLAVHSEKARKDVQCLAGELEAVNRRLREYAVQAEELAVTRERNRIAREVHDSLGHYLTVVNVQLEAARALESTNPARARAAIAKAQAFTQEGLQDIRRSLASLRSSPLDNKSLTDALQELVSTSNGGGLPAVYELQGTPRPLASPAELSLYRAVQEGLTNARKHAQAKQVRVILDFKAADRTSVVVQDNGLGAAPEATNGGFGLLGLRERAQLLGGTVQVESHPHAGFTLKLEVPG